MRYLTTLTIILILNLAFGQSKKELNEIILRLKTDSARIANELRNSEQKVIEFTQQTKDLKEVVESSSIELNKKQESIELIKNELSYLKETHTNQIKTKERKIDSLIILSNTSSNSELKISRFGGYYGWMTVSITAKHSDNITLLLYPYDNEYYEKGKPRYILQGKITAPPKYPAEENNDIERYPVNFNVLWDESQGGDAPCSKCIYYLSIWDGKDVLGKMNNEDYIEKTKAR
ncbi:hypothetical protein OAW23_10435 [Flavobacteriales bacterium]|nr:hypothetical protein [Flavobacteriales bacterium]